MPRLPTLILLALCASTLFAADTASVSQLGWMSGHWCSSAADENIEEYWMPPHGEVMVGVGRTVKGARTVAFEFLRIAIDDGVPTYIAQPQGRPATLFKRTGGGANWVRFENPAHDFPTRIEYRREGEKMRAQTAGPGRNGKEQVIPFEYTRCRMTD